jgi:hypothetical protein
MTFCAVVSESTTWNVMLVVDEAVGVPESTPALLSVRPAGRGLLPVARLQV